MFFIYRLSFILKLSFIFYYTVHAVPVFKKGKCIGSFQGSAKNQIEFEIRSLGVERFIEEYREQKGYVQLSENLTVRMDYAYKLVSKFLAKSQMSRLKWQIFQGKTEEFVELRNKLLNESGELRKEYLGMKGYAAFADKHFQGEMQKTFLNVSVVLEKREMNRLSWQAFQGKTEEFFQLKDKLLKESGELKEEYLGIKGYAAFADKHFQGGMEKTFKNISTVLSEKEKNRLGWQAFRGKTEEFFQLRNKLLNENGELKREYRDMKGYAAFADKYYQGNMAKTYVNVSAVSETREMDRLGWQQFQGKTEEFFQLKDKLFNEKGELKGEYRDMKGYAAFADKYFQGEMRRTFINVSAVLEKREMNRLGWQAFQRKTEEFFQLKDKLLNESGELKREYRDMKGYAAFADKYFQGEMQKTYVNVSAVSEKREMNQLGWQAFRGKAEDFFELRNKLLKESGELKEEYIGIKGYAAFADKYFQGEMQKTYVNVSAVLEKREMNRLGWQAFQGKTEDFFELRNKLLKESGELKREYRDMKGYAAFADKYFQGNMAKTFHNVSAVLGGQKEMNRLGWQAFQGTIEDFFELRGKLLNESGELKEEYIGMKGYAAFADKYFQGEMQKTYVNVSAVSEKREMNRLGWQAFRGKTEEFFQLRNKLLKESGELKREYRDMKGYAAFADKYYQGNMAKTFHNVSAVLGGQKEMNRLGWQQFQGTTEGFFELRGKLLNESGELKEEYLGMKGYAAFADKHFQGEMLKIFLNVSAVLGGAKAMKELGLGWKLFRGTTDQYRELKELFDTNSIGKLRDRKGQEYIAETIFKENTIRTYVNVSNLREELLGSWGAFKQLNWQKN